MSRLSPNSIALYKELKDEIGAESAQKVFNLFKGQQIYFPESLIKEFQRRAIVRDYCAGCSYRQLARKYSYSEKHIRSITRAGKTE